MSTLTQDFNKRAGPLLSIHKEYLDNRYLMFNDGGVECETGEFLYGLVRLHKPRLIVETGTHKGISAAYMAQAQKDNGAGLLDTIEWESEHVRDAQKLLRKLGLYERATVHYMDSKSYHIDKPIDLLFLDTEPALRFAELVRFFPHVEAGGLILMHDTPFNLSQGFTNPDHPEIASWPFGELPEEIKDWVGRDLLRVVHFNNPRGLTMFYKPHLDAYRWR